MKNAITKSLIITPRWILKIIDMVLTMLAFALLFSAGYQMLGLGNIFIGFSLSIMGAMSLAVSSTISNVVFYRELTIDRE